MKRHLFSTIFLLFLSAFLSCRMASWKQVDIEGIGWILTNIDPGYWIPMDDSATQFVNFDVHYTGNDLEISDFATLTIYSVEGDTTWTVPLDGGTVHVENQLIHVLIGDSLSFFSDNGSVMPIGEYNFALILSDGSKTESSIVVPEPGSASTSRRFAFNEDYTGIQNSDYARMLYRPEIIGYRKEGSIINIEFSIDDPLLYGGYVRLYDQEFNSIAYSDSFREYGTGTVGAFVNAGNGLYSDGRTNVVTLSAFEMNYYQSSASFADIAAFSLSVTDGNQYLGTSGSFDSESLSSLFLLDPLWSADNEGFIQFATSNAFYEDRTLIYIIPESEQTTFFASSINTDRKAGYADYGIVFCYQDSKNYYYYLIGTSGSWEAGKVVDGVSTRIGFGSSGHITQTDNTLELRQESPGLFYPYVNGSRHYAINDNTFSGGASGFIVRLETIYGPNDYRFQMTTPVVRP